jgi:hypothetical protein
MKFNMKNNVERLHIYTLFYFFFLGTEFKFFFTFLPID